MNTYIASVEQTTKREARPNYLRRQVAVISAITALALTGIQFASSDTEYCVSPVPRTDTMDTYFKVQDQLQLEGATIVDARQVAKIFEDGNVPTEACFVNEGGPIGFIENRTMPNPITDTPVQSS